MKAQGLRYFSSLTNIQKDRTIYLIVKAKLGLSDVCEALAKGIINQIPFDDLIQTRVIVEEKIKKQKCFLHDGIYYPLNVREILINQ